MTQIAAGLLVVAGLYWAQTALVPVAIAILLSFLLAPVADRLERFHFPRIASLIAITVLALTLVAGVGLLASNQVYSIANSLPKYRQNIEERLRFFTSAEPEVIGKAAKMVKRARKDVAEETKQQQASAGPGSEPNDAPLPVEIHQPPPTGLELLKIYAAPVLGPLGKAGLVVIFVIFILLQREDLRDRLIRLLGQDRLDVTTRAFDDAGTRISRYLLAQFAINLTYGLPVALGLWLLGLPGALLWGVLAALLRFIPFLGPWLAASMPILLSLAVFDGWYLPLAVVGLFAVLELFSNNVMEPWLYGSSTGLSPVGVILAVVFWSALWGLVGLVLAIPLTVCLVVAGRHLPQFQFFTILLSRDPALLPAERIYQRLLAGDQDEVEELAYEYGDRHGLMRLYDHIMVPALHLAERNRHAGHLDDDQVRGVLDGITAIVADMGERQKHAAGGQQPDNPRPNDQHVVLCLPARDAADELTAVMFAQVLHEAGVAAEIGSEHTLVGEALTRVAETTAALVCVSALPPRAINHARYLCRRLASHDTRVPIIVGLWNVHGNLERMRARLTEAGASQVVTTFEGGADQIQRRLSGLAQISA
ncbi:MAG: AI-2E family transporter [Nitrococcus sp.]|nr:AI-2E family transporter [Nitrococcus sp.]